MDSRTRQRVEGSARPGSIPLRPELVEFMSARCLSRYSRCSKVVRADVREANLWQLLANRQAPRPTPRTARDALEDDAISRVRSHVRRRLLADALAEVTGNCRSGGSPSEASGGGLTKSQELLQKMDSLVGAIKIANLERADFRIPPSPKK